MIGHRCSARVPINIISPRMYIEVRQTEDTEDSVHYSEHIVEAHIKCIYSRYQTWPEIYACL